MPASHDVDQVTEQEFIPLSTVLTENSNDHPSYATAATIHTTINKRPKPYGAKQTETYKHYAASGKESVDRDVFWFTYTSLRSSAFSESTAANLPVLERSGGIGTHWLLV